MKTCSVALKTLGNWHSTSKGWNSKRLKSSSYRSLWTRPSKGWMSACLNSELNSFRRFRSKHSVTLRSKSSLKPNTRLRGAHSKTLNRLYSDKSMIS